MVPVLPRTLEPVIRTLRKLKVPRALVNSCLMLVLPEILVLTVTVWLLSLPTRSVSVLVGLVREPQPTIIVVLVVVNVPVVLVLTLESVLAMSVIRRLRETRTSVSVPSRGFKQSIDGAGREPTRVAMASVTVVLYLVNNLMSLLLFVPR